MAYLINSSHHSVCLYVYVPFVARQRLCKNVTTEPNTNATIELLDASFCMRSASYQGTYAITSCQNFMFVYFVFLFAYCDHRVTREWGCQGRA
jgi:hypothetical protein